MKQKYYHKKLIRDNIPEFIESTGGEYETRVMDGLEFEKELKKKLVEEAMELNKAPKEELLNELSDVLELIKSIAAHYKIPYKDVVNYQIDKRKKRGAFHKKIISHMVYW